MRQFKTILTILFGVLIRLSVPLALSYAVLTSKTVPEGILALGLVLGMGLYYARPLALLLIRLPHWKSMRWAREFPLLLDLLRLISRTIGQWILQSQEVILDHLPGFDGISIFGRKILRIEIDIQFVPTPWPIAVLFTGIIIRLVIGRFVRHERLQQVAREYWLFISTYTILALIVSSIIHWNFLGMMLALAVVVFILAAGVLRLGSDVITALWNALKVLGRLGKIVMMYVALLAAKVTRFLRNVVRLVREFYQNYIVEPLRRFHRAIQKLLDRAEKTVSKLLNEERLDE